MQKRRPQERKFESPADAGLSNCSIVAEAPAAAFGKTASACFASARYKFEDEEDTIRRMPAGRGTDSRDSGHGCAIDRAGGSRRKQK